MPRHNKNFHECGGIPVWGAPEEPEGTRGPGCGAYVPNCGTGGGGAWPGSTQTPPTDWRPPRGLRGLAGLRADAPSEARGADGERAGRPRGGRRSVGATSSNSQRGRRAGGPPPTGASSSPARQRTTRRPEHPWRHEQHHSRTHNDTRPRPVSRPRPRHAHAAPLTTAPPAIRRSCPRDPRPRRGQPRGGRRGRGTGSRTRSPGPHCGRSGSTAGRHRARHTRRA